MNLWLNEFMAGWMVDCWKDEFMDGWMDLWNDKWTDEYWIDEFKRLQINGNIGL